MDIGTKRGPSRATRSDVVSAIGGAFDGRAPVTTGQLLTEASHHDAGRAVVKALHTLPTDQRYCSIEDVVDNLDPAATHGGAGTAR